MSAMIRNLPIAAAAMFLTMSALSARAQDLYDTTVLRTFNLQFDDANWLALLRSNYASATNIVADLEVDGVTYPDVGVRIRGNTSYTALPPSSEKFSLKIDMDFINPDQDLLGYDSINLNNGFRDPTFTREVVYNNFVSQFIPNPRANHVLVTLNGQNWGVYINVQQPDKRMLRDYFPNDDGLRISCQNNPNGPGLRYNGPDASAYTVYEIQNDGGLADPVAGLIAVTFSLTNEPLASWPSIDTLFAIDPSIWSVALENLLTDDDSYINKGCDFQTYRDPLDGRMHLMQRDANETFTQSAWTITRNFNAANKPVLSRVLAVPELRQRYMAHYRTIRRDMTWPALEPVFTAHRNLIDAAVQADPKKLYSYTLFQNNFTGTVNMPLAGLAGGSIVGLQQFVTARNATLDAVAELNASAPAISAAQASAETPAANEPVWITANVAAVGSAVAGVELFYRPTMATGYSRTPMLDDGVSGDGAAGDGVYGALLPVNATSGQRVAWYVGARASNANASAAFLPELAERGPRQLQYAVGALDGMRITEWMYAGVSGEFIELTNVTDAPIDMTGWSIDDDSGVAGTFALGAFGVVQPGESVIVTEAVEAAFRTAWSLAPTVRVIGELGVISGNNLGRNDQINLYDGSAQIHDRLFYGDQTFPGTIRTQNISGQPLCSALGQNTVAAWQLSVIGDAFGSVAAGSGDVGTPGTFVRIDCADDVIFSDGFD